MSDYDPTSLIAGDFPLKHRYGTIEMGQVLVRGTVLGKKTLGAAAAAAKAGGNTGNGTLTMDAVAPVGAGAKPGVYQVRCTAAAANNGTFRVTDPDGFVLGDIVMAGGAGAFDNDIKFALADGAADFIVGDGFDITVAAGGGKLVKSLAAALDGSAKPVGILPSDADATDADVASPYYVTGEFAAEKLTYGAGHDADTVEAAFAAANQSIFIRKVGAVA